MNHPQEIEELPAPPLEIPQVTIRWNLPRGWFDFINARSACIIYEIEKRVSSSFGRFGMLPVDERFAETFTRRQRVHTEEISRASDGEMIRVESVVRGEVWRAIQEAAASVNVPPQSLMLVLVASWMSNADEGKKAHEAWRKETSRKRAAKTPVLGKVVTGPWESEKNERAEV